MPKRVVVTSALPYANGPIHYGHIVGAYLPADVYVRYRRMLGDDVHYVCGTDEHGVAITMRAEDKGEDYAAYVDHWHDSISKTLAEVDLSGFDVVIALTPEAAIEARRRAPKAMVEFWDIENPSEERGGRDAVVAAYARVRDALARKLAQRFPGFHKKP